VRLDGKQQIYRRDFRGYKQSTVPKIDEVLARTDPKTACGEYLRRYWHPVALTSEVSEIPKRNSYFRRGFSNI
jgi:hypothetical protein